MALQQQPSKLYKDQVWESPDGTRAVVVHVGSLAITMQSLGLDGAGELEQWSCDQSEIQDHWRLLRGREAEDALNGKQAASRVVEVSVFDMTQALQDLAVARERQWAGIRALEETSRAYAAAGKDLDDATKAVASLVDRIHSEIANVTRPDGEDPGIPSGLALATAKIVEETAAAKIHQAKTIFNRSAQ